MPKTKHVSKAKPVSKAKKRGKRPAPAFIPARRGAPAWVWPLVLAGIVAGGVLVIIVARAAGGPKATAPPDGVETITVTARNHVAGPVNYDRTPPAGGNHSEIWLNCGVYDQPVPSENAVHSLEHGAAWVTYDPSLPGDQVNRLREVVRSRYRGQDRYVILSPFPGLPAPVVATAWGAQLRMDNASDERLGQFLSYYVQGPQAPEPGAACSGGVGNPTR